MLFALSEDMVCGCFCGGLGLSNEQVDGENKQKKCTMISSNGNVNLNPQIVQELCNILNCMNFIG